MIKFTKTIVYIFTFIILFNNLKSQNNNLSGDSISYFVKSAQSFYKEKNYLQAIKLATKVLERDSLNEKANFIKVDGFFKLGEYTKVVKGCKYILSNHIGNPKVALNDKGMAESALLNFQESNNNFKQVLGMDSLNRIAYYYLGYNSYYLKDYSNSILYLKKADKLKPNNFETLKYIGESYLMLNNADSGLYYFDKAQLVKNNSEDVYIGKAKAFLVLKKYNNAEELLIKANNINPTAEAYLVLANVYEGLGNNVLWYETLNKLKTIDPNFEGRLMSEIRLLFILKEYQEVVNKAKEGIVKKSLQNDYLLFYEGMANQFLGNFSNAIINFKSMDSIYNKKFRINLELGICYENINKREYALENYRKYSKDNPIDEDGLYYRGSLSLKMRKYDEAKKCFLSLLNTKKNFDIYNQLVTISLVEKEYIEALQYSENGLKLTTKGTEEEYLLTADKIISFIMLKDYKSAINIVDNFKSTDYSSIMSMKVYKCISLFGLGNFNKINTVLSSINNNEINSNEFLFKCKLFCLLYGNNNEEYIKWAYDYCNENPQSLYAYNFSEKLNKKSFPNHELIENKYVLIKDIDTTINFTFGFINDSTVLNKIFTPLLNKLLESTKVYHESEIIYLLIAQLKSNLNHKDALNYFDKSIERKTDFKLGYYLRGIYKRDKLNNKTEAEIDFRLALPIK
jgi:tetratricopeptide (TPR) repeat protein